MQTLSSDNASTQDPDDFNTAPNQHPSNLEGGAEPSPQSGTATNPSHTPQYGDFGHAETAALNADTKPHRAAGTNPDGEAAPSTIDPLQRGSVPQNLDPEAVRLVQDSDNYEEQREGWARDDPRYAGGTRNWATNEPANKSTGAEPETADSERTNPNDGSNDNPDEFSALRPDGGAGVPGK